MHNDEGGMEATSITSVFNQEVSLVSQVHPGFMQPVVQIADPRSIINFGNKNNNNDLKCQY